jgi:protein CpxP
MLYHHGRRAVRFLAAAALPGVLALAAACASAQGTGPAPAPPPEQAPPTQQSSTAQPPPDPMAERIAYLHERLRITSAQEPLWGSLAQVMRQNATALEPFLRQRFQAATKGNAVETLDADAKLDAAQLDELKKFAAAFQALYDSMSDQQRKIADYVFRRSQFSDAAAAPLPFTYYPSSPAPAPDQQTYAAIPAYPGYPPDVIVPNVIVPDDGAVFLDPFVGIGPGFVFHDRPGFRHPGFRHPDFVHSHGAPFHPGGAPGHGFAMPGTIRAR